MLKRSMLSVALVATIVCQPLHAVSVEGANETCAYAKAVAINVVSSKAFQATLGLAALAAAGYAAYKYVPKYFAQAEEAK